MTQYIYDFEQGSRDMRELLGGKGANLAEMTSLLGPGVVPAGFTVTTAACVAYLERSRTEPEDLASELEAAVGRLERRAGRRLGDARDPLLVSVRSGARVSMPGMLDTVLNLGLNDESVEGLARQTEDERFAWDAYRRLIQMFGSVVRSVPAERFQEAISSRRTGAGVRFDSELSAGDLEALTGEFKAIFGESTGEGFPGEPWDQLRQAVRAVFDSWWGRRAVEYRRIHGIPDAWGTAVNVQQMVFGNRGEDSGSGVAFSRDEITGAPQPSGDFLPNAQGEDVVSGTRNPLDLAEMKRLLPDAHAELMHVLRALEAHYEDMQDTEFTVEHGRLYMLQTRAAKRPAQAAVRFAADAVSEGLLTREEALAAIDAGSLEALLHPRFDQSQDVEVLTRGVAASPGAAVGEIVLDADEAVAAANDGRGVILVRPFTEADDVAGFFAARGILTAEGGKASHAALVARGMGRPCVAGASEVEIDLSAREVRIGDVRLAAGDRIAIDGTSGIVTADEVELIDPKLDANFERVLAWADDFRRLGVRANADTPEETEKARELGAEGIGLCRTEHMFMTPERQPLMRAMILASTREERERALAELLPLQQSDFERLFEVMGEYPVTIRLLDPPLHEFLPGIEEVTGQLASASGDDRAEIEELERLRDRVTELAEANPMLGTRGVRLGILHPEIYEMQAKAIIRAALAVAGRGGARPKPEIMVPLVAYERELELVRDLVSRILEEEGGSDLDLHVGTMIEIPRACFAADRIAGAADFFSFGTNDLTQMALGFSRDDIEARILARYIEMGILDRSPFEVIDRPGVGWLVRLAAWTGREGHPGLGLGICGEHGGDPESIAFFDLAGLDYVSCSPFRVPIARLAAAQAQLGRLGHRS